jgi:hypothetical protein
MDELFDPQSSPNKIANCEFATRMKFESEIYCFFFFFEAFLVAGFSVVAAGSSFFETARFALGAAAAPPRFRRLLAASFAGFASADASGLALFSAGRSSLLNEIVTWQKCLCSR